MTAATRAFEGESSSDRITDVAARSGAQLTSFASAACRQAVGCVLNNHPTLEEVSLKDCNFDKNTADIGRELMTTVVTSSLSIYFPFAAKIVPMGSPSRRGSGAVYVFNINQPSFLLLF